MDKYSINGNRYVILEAVNGGVEDIFWLLILSSSKCRSSRFLVSICIRIIDRSRLLFLLNAFCNRRSIWFKED